jgi:hypothetical protein
MWNYWQEGLPMPAKAKGLLRKNIKANLLWLRKHRCELTAEKRREVIATIDSARKQLARG